MDIYRFRILLDSVNGVFRDIEISPEDNFLQLHNSLLAAFGFSGMEMASFYLSNESWDKGEEIALMDMMEDPYREPLRTMEETHLKDVLNDEGDRLLYVYDFMRMWIFLIELVSIVPADSSKTYPQVVLLVGDAPGEFSKKEADPLSVDFAEDSDLFEEDYEPDENEGGFESFDENQEY